MKAKEKFTLQKNCIKRWFNKNSIGKTNFCVGDLVLKWDKSHEEKGKHTMFQQMWLDPFGIVEQLGPSTFLLQDLSGKRESLHVNGHVLKK